eukprot:NODE_608_length_5442_cov_0.955830.p4 type:complete len:294 gc:universal NODE_608_length_5442_cov_0.955830:3188-4069(+)
MIALLGTPSSGITTIKRLLIELYNLKIVDGHEFENSAQLLEFLTPQWDQPFCIINIEMHWKAVQKRPFICFCFVDAPVMTRLERFRSKFGHDQGFHTEGIQPGSQIYYEIIQISHLKIVNNFESIDKLKIYLKELNPVQDSLIRPDWDTYFIRLARLGSKRSNCMKRQVGCVIVHNNRIVSTGYNGTPQGIKNCRDGSCPRCNGGAPAGVNLDTCLCIHAEDNAIIEAGRVRIQHPTKLYCTLFPCVSCSKKIVQVGISEVIYDHDYNEDLKSVCMSLFNEANILVRKHCPIN